MRELDTTYEIVDAAFRLSRLLGLLPDSRSYLATWVTLKVTVREGVNDAGEIYKLKAPKIEHRTELAILTGETDGSIKAWGPLDQSGPMPADWDVRIGYQPAADSLISAKGFTRARDGKQPDVLALFNQLVSVFDRFVDLSYGGIAGQAELTELLAVYTIGTWLSAAYASYPYLWPNGDKGAGKTKVLTLVARLGYLGQVILAGGTYAALRDLAEYGATLCFDDAENLSDPRKSDPDKRALLLAGNRKGAFVPVKEPKGKNGWQIRNVSAYCPKVFSAIRLPDAVLARRTIVMPLVRSADPKRANHDVEEDRYWPYDRRRLVDDLWTFGLHYLPAAKAAYDDMGSVDLTGPGFEPWRPLFATAKVLEDAGVGDLLDRIRRLATLYQGEKAEFEYPDATRLAVIAVAQQLDVWTLPDVSERTAEWLAETTQFTASDITQTMNRLALDEGIADGDEEYTNAKRVGRILDRLRIAKYRDDKTTKRTRQRTISRNDALRLLHAYVARNDSNNDDSEAHNDDNSADLGQNKTSNTSSNVQMSNGLCRECGRALYLWDDLQTGLCASCRAKAAA